MILTEQEVDALRKSLPAVCKHQDVIRAAESAVLEKLKAQERDRNLLNYSCQMCLDTGVLPKAAILPEPPDVKCPNGCRPKKQLPPDDVVRDAERYRFLRDEAYLVNPVVAVVWKRNDDRDESEWVNTVDGYSLDCHIDAAMEKMK